MNRHDAELIARQVDQQLEARLADFRTELATTIDSAIKAHAKANPFNLTPAQIETLSAQVFSAIKGFITRQVQPVRQRVADLERSAARRGRE